jgi:hypothetical protein
LCPDAVDALIRSQLINLYEYDKYLAASLEAGTNPAVLSFVMFLAKVYLIDDRSVVLLINVPSNHLIPPWVPNFARETTNL